MNNADLPANPSPIDVNGDTSYHCIGLSKREQFAAMALQGILVNAGRSGIDHNEAAYAAVNQADNLLKELSK